MALVRAMALATAADSCGAARSITERTIAYMKTREQFGQPIAGFQALKHRAADLATKLAVIDEMVAHAVAPDRRGRAGRGYLGLRSPRPKRPKPLSSSPPTACSCTVASASPGTSIRTSSSSARA